MKSKVFCIQSKKLKVTKLGLQKLHICPKVTKMGSMIGHRVDYNGVGALRGLGGSIYLLFPMKVPPGGPSYRNRGM